MRLALALDHMASTSDSLELARRLEECGCDEVWVPETWGFDAPSLMGAIAATTSRVQIGAVLPVYSRSPALIAQTAAGVDTLSHGRCMLGLGTSGPQVVEGWHGVPFERPLGELREAVHACRITWRREVLQVNGPRPVPLPPGTGTGMGKPLRLITRPHRERIPIVLATMAPGGVRLAAEIADGWWPLFASPQAIEGPWAAPLAEGRARRDPSLGPLGITASFVCAVGGDDVAAGARDAARRQIAFYVGSMGSRERNYYRDAVSAMGFADEADAIQQAALAGRRREAEALVSDAMLGQLALIGDAACVRQRADELAGAGVTTLMVHAATPDPVGTVRRLREVLGPSASG